MTGERRPPFGSWPRTYVITCVVGALYIVLLHWFTAAFDTPGAGS